MGSEAGTVSPEIRSVRAKALSAAAHILATRGIEELSLRAIADSAGIGIASIYHYFENKEELLVNLALMGFGELREQIFSYQGQPEYASPMQASARAFFDFAETRPALFSLMFSEQLMVRNEALREAEYKTLQVYQEAVEADDRIAPRHRANAAHALWAMGRGIAAIASSHPDGKLPPEMAEKLFAGAAYLVNHPDD